MNKYFVIMKLGGILLPLLDDDGDTGTFSTRRKAEDRANEYFGEGCFKVYDYAVYEWDE